jgi:hypothetical protein
MSTSAEPTGPDGDLARRVGSLSPEARAELRDALRKRAAASPGIPRRTGQGPAPLSFSQQRMWFLDQWEPGAPTNNGARAVRLQGDLDTDALARGISAVVERHEILRTTYIVEEREPLQVPLDDWSLEMPVVDLTNVAAENREAELARLLREAARAGFDLSADLMLRPTVYRMSPTEHVLLVSIHHIASDAASDLVFNRELAELYGALVEGRAPQLPELPIQYADYAVWQRQRLQGPVLEKLLSYWRGALADAPERLRLPADHARPQVQAHRGEHRYVSYDGALGANIAALARSEGVTVFILLLAAFDTLLYRFTGQEDVLVGSPFAGRNESEVEGLIGFFTNTLVLRNRLAGNPTFRDLLGRVRTSTAGALAHHEMPFEKLVESLQVRRDPSFNPLFQVNFRANAHERQLLQLPRVETVGSIDIDIGFSRFDLALELQIEGDELGGYFEYDEDLFDAATIDHLAADFEQLLRTVVTAPETSILALGPRRASAGQNRSPIPRKSQ